MACWRVHATRSIWPGQSAGCWEIRRREPNLGWRRESARESFGWERVSLEVEAYYEELWARYVSPTTRHIAPPGRVAARAR